MSNTSKITNLLNQQALTINELALELGISRNSVHQQVTRLEAAGTIVKLQQRPADGAGKPAYQYKIAAGKEDIHSEAFKPVLNALIQSISEDLPEKSRLHLLEKAGRTLARESGLQPTSTLETDIQKSVEAVNALGAMAEVKSDSDHYNISCFSCPVATLVHKEPMTCKLVAAFFSEACGKSVTVRCRRSDTVVCGFSIES